ncbi:intraflagellar transport protein 74 homolog [Limulus polyphemus]|uniref:Intraflagellar transport protein 74 homolog n=1 Tax=Limulus polyphemus TaxID=6850 RepID=A0ABM1RWC6_LIMPO|nr:intraflagellar transport protein 74 homolog [Limulus polyphemus]XP_022235681.1 intraflagellar transport protein 74 homolog [Limulus polyphemus]
MDNRSSSSALRLNSAMRPPTSQRHPTSQRPPTTITPMSRAGQPGTASRLISAASGRPGTRGSIAQGIGLSAQIAVNDRPVSQQGLVAPKTGSRVQQRQVQDKSYFIGLLRSKISELSTEISRMTKESESLSHEQSTYLTYEKRAEVLASELKDLQGELADYNLLVDKLNTDAEMDEVQHEYKELKAQNEQESKNIDLIFEERQAKEAIVRQLEAEIDQERYMAENLIAAMKPELKQKYSNLKESSQDLRNELNRFQQQLDSLTSQKTSLEDELSMSQVKQEAVSLYEKLRELEEKRDTLLDEERGRGTPQQEWDKLLKQVKDDNGELASIERQTVEVRDKITRAQEELSHLEQELEDHQGERITKYRELRKREEGIDNFLVSFDETKEAEEDRQHALERDIVELLEHISRSLAHFQHLPSPQEFAMLKDDLTYVFSEP